MRDRNPCVYILASARHGTIYTGVTSDLPGRLYQHRNGVTGWLRQQASRLPAGILRNVRNHGRSDRAREAAQELAARLEVNLIERQNPEWNDLAPALGIAERAS